MRARYLPFILLSLLVAGCGRKLEGTYEAVRPLPPQYPMPSTPTTIAEINPEHLKKIEASRREIQKQTEETIRRIQESGKRRLEFVGSKVRMGTSTKLTEYPYTVRGKTLELMAVENGLKTIMPMRLNADGSISYEGLRFVRIDKK